MKYQQQQQQRQQQQLSVDLINMVYTAVAYMALAGAAWLLLRLIQACFWLPRHMRRQNDVLGMLQEKVSGYERYVHECEEKEAKELAERTEKLSEEESKAMEAKRKERRECLDMLKKEVGRIRDGGDPYDFDHLLDDEEKQLLKELDEEEDEGDEDGESRKRLDDLQETEKLIQESDNDVNDDDDDEPKKVK